MEFKEFFALFCVFIAAPSIVFGFILLQKRGKNQLEELRIRREMLALEVEKEKLRLSSLAEENRKYDRIIEGSASRGEGRA